MSVRPVFQVVLEYGFPGYSQETHEAKLQAIDQIHDNFLDKIQKDKYMDENFITVGLNSEPSTSLCIYFTEDELARDYYLEMTTAIKNQDGKIYNSVACAI